MVEYAATITDVTDHDVDKNRIYDVTFCLERIMVQNIGNTWWMMMQQEINCFYCCLFSA